MKTGDCRIGNLPKERNDLNQEDLGLNIPIPKVPQAVSGKEIEDFTPLNTSRSKVLMWIRANGVGIPIPRKASPSKKSFFNKRFCCQYHREYGHDTDSCRELQQAIKQLIKNGKLDKFTSNRRHRDHEDKDDKSEGKKPRNEVTGVINMIIGGEAIRDKRLKRTWKEKIQTDKPIITFGPEDGQHIQHPHNDALVINAYIQSYLVKRLLIDEGSAVNALSWNAYKAMGGSVTDLKHIKSPITSFCGGITQPMGVAKLQVEFGDHNTGDIKAVRSLFNIVDIPFTYNRIIGRPILYEIDAATSIWRLTMKIPLETRILTIRGDQAMAQQCYQLAVKPQLEAFPLATFGEEKQRVNPEPVDRVQTIQIAEGKNVKMGSELEHEVKKDISRVLMKHSDSFTSKATEIIRIDLEIASHNLNVNSGAKPVVQKKRKFAYERQKVITEEIKKLLEVRFIREVQHPEWVANVVLVKKSNGKYRMCVGYTDLNKVCPKDSYPLLTIDQLVDSTAGFKLYSFIDAAQGYHQIPMK